MVGARVLKAYELYRQGLSYREIAQKLGVSVKTAKKYVYLARKQQEHGEEARKHANVKRYEYRLEALENEIKELKKKLDSVMAQMKSMDSMLESFAQLFMEVERLKKEIEEMKKPVKLQATLSISEQTKRLLMDYDKLMEAAKIYLQIMKLLGLTWRDNFGTDTSKWSRPYHGDYASLNRFYAIVHVTKYGWNEKCDEWYFALLQFRKLLSRNEALQKIGVIRDALLKKVEKLPKIIEENIAKHPENAEKVEELYNKLVKLLQG